MIWHRPLLTATFPVLCLLLGACSTAGALHRGEYSKVTPKMVYKTGENDSDQNRESIRNLLNRRLTGPSDNVTSELAVESVIALGKIGEPEDASLLLELLRTDSSEDVRYFAADSIAHLDIDILRSESSELLGSELSELVRNQVERLLKQPS